MTFNNTKKWSGLYLFNEEDIKNLMEILKKYFSEHFFDIYQKNGERMNRCNSEKDFLILNNYKQNRIEKIDIFSLNSSEGQNCKFTFFRDPGLGNDVIECRYEFSKKNNETLFLKDVEEFFPLIKISRFRFIFQPLLHLAFLVTPFYILYVNDISLFGALSAFIVAIEIFFHPILGILLEKVFLGCIFLWGGEIKSYKLRTRIWNFVFGSVIVSLIVGILAGIIANKCSNG